MSRRPDGWSYDSDSRTWLPPVTPLPMTRTKIADTEDDVAALDARLDAAESSLTSLDGRLDTAEAELDTIGNGAWTAFTPTLAADSGNPALGTASSRTGRYTRIGRTVIGQAEIRFGTGGTVLAGSGFYQIGLPFGAANPGTATGYVAGSLFLVQASSNDFRAGLIFIDPGGGAWARGITSAVVGLTSSSYPWTWTFSDKMLYNFTYEAAS